MVHRHALYRGRVWRACCGLLLLTVLVATNGVGLLPSLAVSGVCLNEFLPQLCMTSPLHQQQALQPFVELYNAGVEVADLGGWALLVGASRYDIPAGTALGPRAHMVFMSATAGLAFPPFEGTVRLLDAQGTEVDRKTYSNPPCSLSCGRYPDGAAQWYPGMHPSPGEPNTVATPTSRPTATRMATPSATATRTAVPTSTMTPSPGMTATRLASSTATRTSPTPTGKTETPVVGRCVCLSEFLPAPRNIDWDGSGFADYMDEWIELHNPCLVDVDLQGWQLDDEDQGGSRPHTFASGSYLHAGEYAVYYRRDTGIALNNDGDQVRLMDAAGQVMDTTSYVRTAPDVSYSRADGCEGPWTMAVEPSPGEANPIPAHSETYLPLLLRPAQGQMDRR